MIDQITFVKSGLQENEIMTIVETNHLQTNTKAGKPYYDNADTKNLEQQRGVFIRIETTGKLKIECNLHKYHNEINGNSRTNYNLFTMAEAIPAIDSLLKEKNIHPENLRVYNYEIGLNLNVSNDCRLYLDKMQSIGAIGEEKKLYVNPRYKDERIKTTVFHRATRKYYKVYDKNFEAKDKKRTDIPDYPILRIETVNRRVENQTIATFFNPDYLNRLTEQFFREWRTVQFEREVRMPQRASYKKQNLCKQIIELGKEKVLQDATDQNKNGTLSDKQYRSIREFIRDKWDMIKPQIQFIPSPEETEFRDLLKTYYPLLK
ncbi:hypothetical protein EZS27_016696 [termite gut metagenome]|uniref:Replication initiation protein n=1 Tax=termite gut metagenome TaxID=433724 RepID=A0A5J4RPL0_9ZZZZ